jgi:hypothetical protein
LKSTITTTNTDEASKENNKLGKNLTQKEYLIAIRNRLYAVQEHIWLHEYSTSRPSTSKLEPLSENKYNELLRARGELMDEYPLTKLYTDLYDAQKNNLTYAAIYLERLITNFNRQLPMPMQHINQIAVLSFSGQVINLMRGQGAVYHRLLPTTTLLEAGVKRQFQHACFSTNGNYIAFSELHFKENNGGIVRSDALVFDVPKDAKTYGASDSMPVFVSGDLPGAPFFLRFSPDEKNLVLLCTSATSETYSALILVEWFKFSSKDSLAGLQQQQSSSSSSSSINNDRKFMQKRKIFTLLQGNPIFFSYTTSSTKNATIVAHCQKEIVDPFTKTVVNEKAVWLLQRQDNSGVKDFEWKKISNSDSQQRWSTPICHSAGFSIFYIIIFIIIIIIFFNINYIRYLNFRFGF